MSLAPSARKTKRLSTYPLFIAALVATLAGSVLAARGSDDLRAIAVPILCYGVALLFQRWLFGEKYVEHADQPLHEGRGDQLYFAGTRLEPQAAVGQEDKLLDEILSPVRQFGVRIGFGAVVAIYAVGVIYGRIEFRFVDALHIVGALALVPAMSPNHLLIPWLVSFLAVLWQVKEHGIVHGIALAAYAVLTVVTFVTYRFLELETQRKSRAELDEPWLARRSLRTGAECAAVFAAIVGVVSLLLPDFASTESVFKQVADKLEAVSEAPRMTVGRTVNRMRKGGQGGKQASGGAQAKGGGGFLNGGAQDHSENGRSARAGAVPPARPRSFKLPPEITRGAGSGSEPTPVNLFDNKEIDRVLKQVDEKVASGVLPKDLDVKQVEKLIRGDKLAMDVSTSQIKELVDQGELPKSLDPEKFQSTMRDRLGDAEKQPPPGQEGVDPDEAKKSIVDLARKLEDAQSGMQSGQGSDETKAVNDSPKAEHAEAPPEAPSRPNEPWFTENMVKKLFVLLAIVSLLIVASKFTAQAAGKGKRSRPRVSRARRKQLLEELKRLGEERLEPREEVLRGYKFYLSVMDSVECGKETWLPATDYHERIKGQHPALKRDSADLTFTFCDTLYGANDVDAKKLGAFRGALKATLKYFGI